MLNIRRKNDGLGKVFTFASIIGGSGKTLLAGNMAYCLAGKGYKVCLLDCDFEFGDIHRYFGARSEKTFYDFLCASRESRNAVSFVTTLDMGFDLFDAPHSVEEGYIIDSESVSEAIEHLKESYDYIVIDNPSGFSENVFVTFSKSDVVFFPIVLDFLPTVRNLKMSLDVLKDIGFEFGKLRFVLNRDGSASDINDKDVISMLGRGFDYRIANDYSNATESLIRKEPLLKLGSELKISKDISAMVQKELGEKVQDTKKRNMFGWLFAD